jgi:phosphocarrier protein
MDEITLTVQHKVGLHARPAAQFVKVAKKYQSDITVTHGDRTANAKSILNVLGLGANEGAQIVIRAEGDDSGAALSELRELVESNFGGVA